MRFFGGAHGRKPQEIAGGFRAQELRTLANLHKKHGPQKRAKYAFPIVLYSSSFPAKKGKKVFLVWWNSQKM